MVALIPILTLIYPNSLFTGKTYVSEHCYNPVLAL